MSDARGRADNDEGAPLRFTVAIDGPAAAGKGTIGRAVADHFGMAHLDTGLLYRAVARRVSDGRGPGRGGAKPAGGRPGTWRPALARGRPCRQPRRRE